MRTLAVFFLLIIIGCSGPAGPAQTPAPPSPLPSSRSASGARGALPSAADRAEVDLFDVVSAAEIADTPDAVIDAFRYAFGEAARLPLAGQAEIYPHGLEGVAEIARDLLARGAVTDEQREALRRYLGILDPQPEALDRISRPAGTSFFRKMSTRDEEECRFIVASGFYRTPSEDLVCFLYDSYPEGGDKYRIYAPVAWQTNPRKLEVMRLVGEAVVETDAVFSRWRETPSARIVFTPENLFIPGGGFAAASVPNSFSSPYCPVTVWGLIERVPATAVQQTTAHELFHCLQRTFSPPVDGTYGTSRWWVEGTATYFSNAVYPRFDHEHRWIPAFVQDVSLVPLTSMSYPTTVFWQYLENRLGSPEAVFDVASRIRRSNSATDQLRQLQTVPNLEEVWHGFAKAFIDGQIADTAPLGLSRPRPTLPTAGRLRPLTWDGETDYELAAVPFSFGFFRATYAEDLLFTMDYPASGARGTFSARPGDFGDWGEPDPILRTGCGDLERDFLLTSTEIDGSAFYDTAIRYHAEMEDTEECDDDEDIGDYIPDCLLGIWEADLAQTFRPEQMRQMFPTPDGGAAIRFLGSTGSARIEFNDIGESVYTFTDLVMRFRGDTSSGPTTTSMRMNGASEAAYRVDGDELRFTPGQSATRTLLSVTLPIGGTFEDTIDLDGIFETAERGITRFTCTSATLRVDITGPGGGENMFENGLYRRVRN